MNVKAVIGLLVVGVAALTFSSGRGSGRRRRTTFKGLGSPPAAHAERFAAAVAEARGALGRGRAALGKGDYATVAATVQQVAILLGQARAERIGGQNLPDHVTPLLRDLDALRAAHRAACREECASPPAPVRAVAGLGLDPDQHGINRSTHSVQTGFKIKDAVKAARNGWCSSAIRALREAEYEAGQTTAHSKSIIGEAGVMQRRKAQATRVAVNRAAKQVMAACTFHRARPKAVSKRQGSLPF